MRPITRTMPLALLVLGSCQDYLFERVCVEQIIEEDQSFAAAAPTPADILFIVDNSGSMREEQENLAENFELFINEIAGGGDYRIAVVTTDQSNARERAGLASFAFSSESPYFARTEFDQGACVDTTIAQGCFRGDDPANRVIDAQALNVEDQIALFRRNVQVGTCGSGTERGLQAMRSALGMTGPNQCNAGFLREEANLVLIFVSDENDAGSDAVQTYVDFVGAVKPFEKIRVASIVGYADGDASDCRADAEGRAVAECGSICASPPPLGSQQSCTGSGQSNCPLGEICFNTGSGRECRDILWDLWNDQECSSCSSFLTDDCCLADAGTRYTDFVRQIETRIAAAAPGIEANGCEPRENQAGACLLDSVCQASFGETLVLIARELVVVNEYRLTPTAEYPPGVRARIVGGRFGETGTDLVPGEDFVVIEQDGVGVALRIVNEDRVPAPAERIQIIYVSDVAQGENQPEGVCPTTTSTI
ncbi:MAG: hypothetical protein AAF449_04420 [Myxococcota bacterium]